jgi:hypothetical protein
VVFKKLVFSSQAVVNQQKQLKDKATKSRNVLAVVFANEPANSIRNKFGTFFRVWGDDPETRTIEYLHHVVSEVDVVIAAMAMWFRWIPCVFLFLKFMLETKPEHGCDVVMHICGGPEPPKRLCCPLTMDMFQKPVRSKYVGNVNFENVVWWC